MDPGPKDPSVLHLQDQHRSSDVWIVGGGDTQRSRRRNPNQGRFPKVEQKMVPLLVDMGFDGVARLCSLDLDWGLITALIERWRPETHSFHLPTGECTITLQDVNILLGLRIDGCAVTGGTDVEGGWPIFVEKVFGQRPPKTRFNGSRLQLSWLNDTFPSLPDDASEEQVVRYTQAYVLQLIGGVLFTDHSGSQVHCMYIPLLSDLDRCKRVAWGAGVLSFLYRELCKASKRGTEENAGCILLLQLWAWERLPSMAPVCRGPILVDSIWTDVPGPLGLKWSTNHSFTDTTPHVVSAYRVALDVLSDSQFIWKPYDNINFDTLSPNCRDGLHLWLYRGPLICFFIVETHLPDRCMRQFGLIQDIPQNANYSSELHKIDLKGKPYLQWDLYHSKYIEHWNNRLNHVISGDTGVGVVDGYSHWYIDSTRRFHSRIGGARAYMFDLLENIIMVAKGELPGDIDVIATAGKQILHDQLSMGVFQDFPTQDRRQKEIKIRDKPKRVGHKGGRGGVNAPRKRGMQSDESATTGDDNVNEEQVIGLEDDRISEMHEEDEQHVNANSEMMICQKDDNLPIIDEENNGKIDSTSLLSQSNWNLLTPSDAGPTQCSQPPIQSPTCLAVDASVDVDHVIQTQHVIDTSMILSQPNWNSLTPDVSPMHCSQPHVQSQTHLAVNPSPDHVIATQRVVKSLENVYTRRLRPRKTPKCGTGGHKGGHPY